MRKLIGSLMILILIQEAQAEVCDAATLDRIGTPALKLLATHQNTLVDLEKISNNYRYTKYDYEISIERAQKKLRATETESAKTPIYAELRRLTTRFCNETVFESRDRYRDYRASYKKLDIRRVDTLLDNLNTWTRWCSQEGKTVMSQALNEIRQDLASYRDIGAPGTAKRIQFYVDELDYLNFCVDDMMH